MTLNYKILILKWTTLQNKNDNIFVIKTKFYNILNLLQNNTPLNSIQK